MKPLKVLLADDHSLVRAGIRLLLESFSGVAVVGEAHDGAQALTLLKTRVPDILLLDITMPGMSGLEVAARVAKDFPKVKVVILSMHAKEEYVLQALRVGVAGYLHKDSEVRELDQALKTVARGKTYFSPSISHMVIHNYRSRTSAPSGTETAALTPRQREVLKHVAEGKSTKRIAHMLKLSVKTVETHRAQLMSRLGIHDIASLVKYAIRIGLIPSD